jgi:hypothetical protein
MSEIQNVGGVSTISLMVEGVQPDDAAWTTDITFKHRGDHVEIEIRDIKPGGRTYKHLAILPADTFAAITSRIGELNGA